MLKLGKVVSYGCLGITTEKEINFCEQFSYYSTFQVCRRLFAGVKGIDFWKECEYYLNFEVNRRLLAKVSQSVQIVKS